MRSTVWRVLLGVFLVLVPASSPTAPALAAETARQILDRRKALDDGARRWDDRRQQLTFAIRDRRGAGRTLDVEVSERRYPGDERKTIVFFRSPPEVEGTGLLAFNHKGKPADQWLYLSELSRVRQISGSGRKEKFVGTDLTFRDLDILTEMPSWSEADAATSLRGEESVDGVACHVIELAPKREDIGYAKIVLWLGKDDLVPRRLEFSEDAAKPSKRITQRDVRMVGAIPVAFASTVETLDAGTSTEVTVRDTKFDLKLGDDAFTQRALEQGPQ